MTVAGGRVVSSYVALGDSFTAGREAVEAERWPDILARAMRAGNPDLSYANLAADGARSADVLAQVPAALERDPDLVTVICGVNDVLYTSRPDVSGHEECFDAILGRLREGAPAAAILTATAPDSWRFMDLRPRTQARVEAALEELNAITRTVADRHAVPYVEAVGHPGFADPGNFSADGLHPSALGHRHAAREIAHSLRAHYGVEGDFEKEALL